ncbi:MAG: ATP-binding protein, partial [Salinisphaera sp.]|nr:ATP-binding protein [Salinisphaera sp.]
MPFDSQPTQRARRKREQPSPAKEQADGGAPRTRRNAFLLALTDAFQDCGDPEAGLALAARTLAEHLDASRAGFIRVYPGLQDSVIIQQTNRDPNMPDILGRRGCVKDFGAAATAGLAAGQTLRIADTATNARTAGNPGFRAARVRALMAAPARCHGRLAAVLFVHDHKPRRWRRAEADLLREAAERAWAASERVRTEAALRESQTRLRLATDAAGLGVYRWDIRNDRSDWANVRAPQILGLAPNAEAPNAARFSAQFSHPEDRAAFQTALAQARRGGAFAYLGRFYHRNGDLRWAKFTGQLERGADGAPLYLHGTIEDVTATKEREQRDRFLAELDGELRILDDPDAIVAASAQRLGEHLQADRCAFAEAHADQNSFALAGEYDRTGVCPIGGKNFRMSDFGAEGLRLMRAGQSYVVDDVGTDRRVTANVLPAYAALQMAAVVCVPLHKAGRVVAGVTLHQTQPRRWLPAEIALIETVANRCWEALQRARAVSDLRAREAALREADRRKDEFIAMLAHELRNPLAPVRNGLQILHQCAASEQTAARAHRMAEGQIAHMARLLDDLLDINRLNHGRIELKRQRVWLAPILETAVEVARPRCQAARVALHVTAPAAAVQLDADPTRLAQIIGNLLHNAAKFTQAGGSVWLTVDTVDGDAVIRVRDNGTGIPAGELERVFETFVQLDGASDRARGGLGLGLSVVKQLVDLHGGQTQAHSAGPGQGSEFVVRLPTCQGAPALGSPRKTSPAVAAHRRILVVDDNHAAADSLVVLLELGGHEVHCAYDGAAGVAAAERLRPEVVLLDIAMPEVDGLEACRRIRAAPWGRDMFVIALTGW